MIGSEIYVAGLVATTPRKMITRDGLTILSFRLASHTKKFDTTRMRWVDGDTNWFTITAFNNLAVNADTSISKGDRIIVGGKLNVRDWDNGDKTGTSVEIVAEMLGHDLSFGTSVYTRASYTAEPISDLDTTYDLTATD